jgi:GT2 family glycosyltransferase
LKAKGELILFLNNDTIVDKNFLIPLIDKLISDKSIAAVQPKILCYPQIEIIDSVGSYFLNTGFLYHYGHNKYDQKKYNVQSEIFSMKGACMLFKKSVLNEIGMFDNKYFAYFEETDLCHRAWLAGYKIMYVPASKIYHKGGQTAKFLPDALLEYHANKNRLYTYMKNFEFSYLIKIIPLHIFFLELSACVYLILLKFSLFLTIQRAIWWNIKNIHTLRIDRREIQKIKKTSNSIFLPHLTKKVGLTYYYHLLATALAGYKD